MSLVDRVLRDYRGAFARIGEPVTIRRYSGKGTARAVSAEAVAVARVTGYEPKDIVGAIQQGDRKVILLNDPGAVVPTGKAALSMLLPLTSDDRLIIRGREVAILGADDSTRRVAGELVAIELQVRG